MAARCHLGAQQQQRFDLVPHIILRKYLRCCRAAPSWVYEYVYVYICFAIMSTIDRSSLTCVCTRRENVQRFGEAM